MHHRTRKFAANKQAAAFHYHPASQHKITTAAFQQIEGFESTLSPCSITCKSIIHHCASHEDQEVSPYCSDGKQRAARRTGGVSPLYSHSEMKESQAPHTQEEPETRQRMQVKETLKNGRSGSRKGSTNRITKTSKIGSTRKKQPRATLLAEAAEDERKVHSADIPSSPNVAPASLESTMDPYSSGNQPQDIPREEQQVDRDPPGLPAQVRMPDSDPSALRRNSEDRLHHGADGSRPDLMRRIEVAMKPELPGILRSISWRTNDRHCTG